MSAYIILFRESEVRDPDSYAEYQRVSRENPGPVQPKPLVVYGKMEALEGEPPGGVIVLEFADVDAAKAWYNSPGYQQALPHRLKAADFRAVIVEGWTPPKA